MLKRDSYDVSLFRFLRILLTNGFEWAATHQGSMMKQERYQGGDQKLKHTASNAVLLEC